MIKYLYNITLKHNSKDELLIPRQRVNGRAAYICEQRTPGADGKYTNVQRCTRSYATILKDYHYLSEETKRS